MTGSRPARPGLLAGAALIAGLVFLYAPIAIVVLYSFNDSRLVTVANEAGRAVDVGRRTRSIPPATRRALTTRDGCCQFPGCERSRRVDAHHIVHWAHGGRTDLDNLVLCHVGCNRHLGANSRQQKERMRLAKAQAAPGSSPR